MEILIFLGIGLVAGLVSALVGIGGGIVVVPLLVLLTGMNQLTAQGTSLALFLLPIGILGFISYFKTGHVNIYAAVCIACTFIIGSYLGGRYIVTVNTVIVQKVFAVFLLVVGIYLLVFKK